MKTGSAVGAVKTNLVVQAEVTGSHWKTKVSHALISQLAHVDLQCEQREDHEAEDGQSHDFCQLLDSVQQRIDDSF